MHVVSFSSTTSGFQSSSCSKNIFFHPRSVHVKPPCSLVTAWVHLLTFQKWNKKKTRRGSFLFVYCAVYWILSSLNQMKLCVYVRGRGWVTSGQLGESRRRPGMVTRKGVSLSAGLRHSVAKGDHQERERERNMRVEWVFPWPLPTLLNSCGLQTAWFAFHLQIQAWFIFLDKRLLHVHL